MIDSLATGLFVPLSMLYLTARAELRLAEVGLLLSLAGIISLPLPLWIGRLVDRIGPQRIVLAAQVTQAVGFAGYLLPLNAPVVLVSATVISLGQRMFWSSIFVLVSALSDADPDIRARERWLGAIGALRAAGYGAGALFAGIAIAVKSLTVYESAVAVDVVLLLLATGVVASIPPTSPTTSPDRGRGYRSLWTDRPYLALIALNSMLALCNVMLSTAFAPFVVRALPGVTWIVGPLLAMNTVVQAVFQGLAVRLLRPVRRHIALCLAAGLWATWALLCAVVLLVPTVLVVPCLVVSVLCYSAAQLVHSPSSNAMATDAAPMDIRGRYLAAFQYCFAIATVIAPTMTSVLLDIGAAVPWVVLFATAVLTIPATLALARYLPAASVTGRRA
jgi:MFS family permease